MSHYLKKLCGDYGILKPEKGGKNAFRYIIDPSVTGMLTKIETMQTIGRFDAGEILHDWFPPEKLKKLESDILYEVYATITTFGFPKEVFKSLTEEEKEEIITIICEIAVRVAVLSCLKFKTLSESGVDDKKVQQLKEPVGVFAISKVPQFEYVKKLMNVLNKMSEKKELPDMFHKSLKNITNFFE